MNVVNLKAGEWQIYTSKLGAENVANILNAYMILLLNFTTHKISDCKRGNIELAKYVRNEMFEFMKKFEEYGARDTEPEQVVVNIIREKFNLTSDDIDRWS